MCDDYDGCVSIEDVEEIVDQRMAEREAEIREEVRAEYEDEISDLRERVDELESRPQIRDRGDDPGTIGDMWIDYPDGPTVPLGKIIEKYGRQGRDANNRVDEIKEQVADLASGITEDAPMTGNVESVNGIVESEMSWIERYNEWGLEAIDDEPRKRDLHATLLYRLLPDTGYVSNSGVPILESSDKLKRRMKALTKGGENTLGLEKNGFEWTELYRALEALADRSDGKIIYKEDHPKLGRHIRIPNPEELTLDETVMSGPPSRSQEAERRQMAMV